MTFCGGCWQRSRNRTSLLAKRRRAGRVPERDPSAVVEGILSSGRNIRLGRGVVSKTSYVAAIAAIAWVAIIWRWSDNLKTDAGLLTAGLVATGFACWFIRGTHRFAEQNPAQALLE